MDHLVVDKDRWLQRREHHVSTRVETFVGYVLVPLVLPSTRRSGERKPIEIAGSKFQMQTVRFSPDSRFIARDQEEGVSTSIASQLGNPSIGWWRVHDAVHIAERLGKRIFGSAAFLLANRPAARSAVARDLDRNQS